MTLSPRAACSAVASETAYPYGASHCALKVSIECSHDTMIPRASLPRAARGALRPQCINRPNNRRTLASQKSGGFNYETGEVDGIKFASRDIPGPTTQLAVVARAGTRFQMYPGFAEALEKYAFKVRL